jgi:dihydrofolate synthase / folylpolyglutamate synthase
MIEAQAARLSAPLLCQGVDWDAFSQGGRLVVQTEDRALDLPLPALHGPHQIDNAGLAVAAMLATSFGVEDAAFARGVQTVRWPGRLQPLTGGAVAAPVLAIGGEVWVDGGHNAHAAAALARWLTERERRAPRPVTLILALRARKDARAFLAALAPNVARVIAVPLAEDHVGPETISALAREAGLSADAAPSLHVAMNNAAQSPAPRVVISGSLLLAAEALSDTNA